MNVSQPYKDVQRSEDQEELLSPRDVDGTSVRREKSWSSAGLRDVRWSADRGLLAILKDYWWLITTCLLGITIILQLIIWNEISSRSFQKETQVGGDYLGKGPSCSSHLDFMASGSNAGWSDMPLLAAFASLDFADKNNTQSGQRSRSGTPIRSLHL